MAWTGEQGERATREGTTRSHQEEEEEEEEEKEEEEEEEQIISPRTTCHYHAFCSPCKCSEICTSKRGLAMLRTGTGT